MQRSKTYRKAAEVIDRSKLYTPAEAVKIAKDTTNAKFDATVEVAMRLGVDPARRTRWSVAWSTCRTAPARPPA